MIKKQIKLVVARFIFILFILIDIFLFSCMVSSLQYYKGTTATVTEASKIERKRLDAGSIDYTQVISYSYTDPYTDEEMVVEDEKISLMSIDNERRKGDTYGILVKEDGTVKTYTFIYIYIAMAIILVCLTIYSFVRIRKIKRNQTEVGGIPEYIPEPPVESYTPEYTDSYTVTFSPEEPSTTTDSKSGNWIAPFMITVFLLTFTLVGITFLSDASPTLDGKKVEATIVNSTGTENCYGKEGIRYRQYYDIEFRSPYNGEKCIIKDVTHYYNSYRSEYIDGDTIEIYINEDNEYIDADGGSTAMGFVIAMGIIEILVIVVVTILLLKFRKKKKLNANTHL